MESPDSPLMWAGRATVVVVAMGFLYRRMVENVTRLVLLPAALLGRNRAGLKQMVAQSGVVIERRERVQGRVDCAVLRVPEAEGANRWIVYANANGVCWEHIVRFTYGLGRKTGRHVCVFNYRGVGESRGSAKGCADLVDDAIAVIRFVQGPLSEGKAAPDIVLWGHSIGGAVLAVAAATLLTAESEEAEASAAPPLPRFRGALVVDRSFDDLGKVVEDKLHKGPIAGLVGGLLASTMCVGVTIVSMLGFHATPWPTTFSSHKDDSSSLSLAMDVLRATWAGVSLGWIPYRLQVDARQMAMLGFVIQFSASTLLVGYELDSLGLVLLASFALAFEAGTRGYLDGLLLWLVRAQGWVLRPGRIFPRLKSLRAKVITYHMQDEMIPVEASMNTVVPDENTHVVRLDGPYTQEPSSYHMYELAGKELASILKWVKQ